jgi:hypothetical protein
MPITILSKILLAHPWPSLVQPAGAHCWAFDGVGFVREMMRVGLAQGGGPCDGCLAREDSLVGLRCGGGMWGTIPIF